MKRIFTGMLLVFLDFSLSYGTASIEILPDFIGFICIFSGLREVAPLGNRFNSARPWAIFMAVYSGIWFFTDLLGISVVLGSLYFVIAIIGLVVTLMMTWSIVRGVVELEKQWGADLASSRLNATFIALVTLEIASFISLLWVSVAVIMMIADLVVAICFLVAFSKTKNLYYAAADR